MIASTLTGPAGQGAHHPPQAPVSLGDNVPTSSDLDLPLEGGLRQQPGTGVAVRGTLLHCPETG